MPREQPNVVLVMTDQLVPFLTGGYGHSVVQTPSLDRLAAEGVRCGAAYMDLWANEAHEVDRVDLHDPDNLTALRRAYYGLVTYIDRKLGELLAELERTGVREDTIVVFLSDHGDMLGEKGMVQKRCFYEWSVRVPLVVALPDGRGAADGAASVRRRELVRRALEANGTSWDFEPVYDASRQYVR
jgi:arylsulfatase A-like enzyme